MNPFDEIAAQEVVRMKQKKLFKEVIAVICELAEAQDTLTIDLATRVKRGIQVSEIDQPLLFEAKYINEMAGFKLHPINKERAEYSEYYNLFPVLKRYPDKFQQYTRMKLQTFEYILSKVDNCLLKAWCNLHERPIKPEEKLVITLRFLILGASYRDLSFTFAVGKSTVGNIVEEVLNALWSNLGPLHMAPPTTRVLMDTARDFYCRWDFPHCIGAIDVRHIEIKKPANSGSLYFNYKKFFSITLQAVVDSHYRLIAIDVGGYGRQHDATTFRFSKLYEALDSGKIKLPEPNELYGSRIISPYFLLGDGAYPLSDHLMKPYPGDNLSEEQKIFNKRLSRARVVAECAFGQMCQKWHIFYNPIQQPPEKAELIVKGACILHNTIKDIENPHVSQHSATSQSQVLVGDDRKNEAFIGSGLLVRENLKRFFLQNPV